MQIARKINETNSQQNETVENAENMIILHLKICCWMNSI